MKESVQRPEPLPLTMEEVQARGWDEVDIVFITGDAYVDHPSFAAGILTRVLESEGFRVAVLSQPDWHSAEDWKKFGKPRLGFCVSAGNMDSMINHYTANRKVRNEDAYSPGGQIGCRPDRATLSYCQRAREAYPGITIIAGGVEASLRRTAHYDYWSDKVRRSILMDSKAALLSYGMGERSLVEIFKRLDAGEPVESLRDIRGTVWRIGKLEDLPGESDRLIHLPSFEEVSEDKELFAKMTRTIWENLNPFNAKALLQEHGEEAIVVNPPQIPLSEEEMDRIYDLPYTRKPHPFYGKEKIPAYEVIRDSVPIVRGCFGGCAFCSLTAHQGKVVQSRSEQSILRELTQISESKEFKGTISDLGGPTANMYKLGCKNEKMRNVCERASCLYPEICSNLNTDHQPLIELMRKARAIPGIKNINIASGVRTDLALCSPEYIEELIKYHIGGHLKTAPEHVDPVVLSLMKKPPIEKYEEFCELFADLMEKNQKECYLVPYLIAGLPGSNYQSMVQVAEYLKKNGICPEQVQDFIPTPFEIATCIYYTGLDPFTEEKIYVPRGLRERRLQRALLMYYRPEYYHDVKTALKEAHREDLIGNGPDCLIPPYPPKAASLRQTSRIKRLQLKTEKEKQEKTEYRERMQEQARLAEEEQRQKNRKKRESRGFGRSGSSSSGSGSGYRGSARSFGKGGASRSEDSRSGERRSSRPYSRDGAS
ncbi:MAG: YgiQ family radical SAM protein, partial [Planctomycetia bacterium]|nr:YgiQ family radical SAM protein [Planctomycetia bacterium]